MDKLYVIGVDMGGTNTAFGIVDRRGDILFRDAISTENYATGETFVDALGDAINELIAKNNVENQIKGIGMGVPNGNMNDGTVSNAANIAWAKSPVPVQLTKMLSEKTGLPCKLTNDANAAAMGEMAYGKAKGMKDFIVITLGTGLGSGIVSNGQLVVGGLGFAGELGHVTAVRHNGRTCGCGRVGCLETYASATGVARTAREFLELYPEKKSSLGNITTRPLTSKDVSEAAEEGDELALEIFEFTGRILGEAFADFIAFTGPEAIILFGGLARADKFLMKPIEKAIDDNILKMYKGKVAILLSELNDAEAAILGASALAW
jgi:glucokinase